MKRLMLILFVVVFLVVGWSSVSYSEISPEAKVKAIQSLTTKIAARKVIFKEIFNIWKKASPKMKSAIARRLKIQESKIAGLLEQLSNLRAAPVTGLQKLTKEVKGVAAPAKVNLIKRLERLDKEDKEVRSEVYESQPQFQDYKWGSSIEEVRLQINSKEHYVFEIDTPKEKLGFGYRDMILHKKVLVWFLFTPRTEKLCRVKLVWGRDYDNYDNDYGIKYSLLKTLTKKYGEPVRSGLWYDYKWGSYLELWGSVGTTLSYISGEYAPIQVQEEDEIFYIRYRR